MLRWKAQSWKEAREDSRVLKIMQAWLGSKATIEETFPHLKYYQSTNDSNGNGQYYDDGSDPLAGCRQMMSMTGFGGMLEK